MAMKETFERFRAQFLKAYQIRSVEQQLLRLFREGKVFGTVHTSIGQEFSAVFVAENLGPNDVVFSNHRCHGHYLAKTNDVKGLLAEIMGKQSGVCKGFGGSQHLCNDGFFSNGIQGGIAPVSAGIALHHKLSGTGGISVVYLGDGTFGEGAVYETLNIASKWNLPVLFVVEDNMYAQSTSSRQTLAGSFSGRAEAFGIQYYESSIWNLVDLHATAKEAVKHVANNKRPAFLRINLYRLEAHSKGDDDRDRDEIETYRSKDPLTLFLSDKQGCSKTQEALREIDRHIDDCISQIERDAFYPLCLSSTVEKPVEYKPVQFDSLKQVESINQALDRFLDAQPHAVFVGEDIHSPYGGAFKVAKGLSDRYPDRVLTTPISEACIVGLGCGLALMGTTAIVEIMFGDFMTLAFDQIVNHAAKFKQMYGESRRFPLLIRTPMGGGRGYGPTHSQSLEKHFAGIAGVDLFVLHGRSRVSSFYQTLLDKIDTASIVIEHKLLYPKQSDRAIAPYYALQETNERYPTTILRHAEDPDITLVLSEICR